MSTEGMQVLICVMPWNLENMRTGLIRMIMNGWSICENDFMTDDDLSRRSGRECESGE